MARHTRRLFWAAYAAMYDQLWDNAHADLIAAAIIAGLDGRTQVLEVGAGTGVITSRLLDAGVAVHACEPEPHMATRFARKLPAVPLEQVRCDQLSLPAGSRVVVAANVLHMIDNPTLALKQLRAAAGPHGRVVIVTPAPGQTLRDVAAAQRDRGVSRTRVMRFIAWHAALAPLTRVAATASDPTRLRWVEDIDPGAVISTSLCGPFRILVVTGAMEQSRPGACAAHSPAGRYDVGHVDPPVQAVAHRQPGDHQSAVAWPTQFHRAACRPQVLSFRRLNPGGTHGV